MKISTDALSDKIEAAMRLRVGYGKATSFASLAKHTGITERTLRSYVEGATPTAAGLLALCGALGPGFTSDVLSLVHQTAQDGTNEAPEHLRILSALGSLTAIISDAIADGHVDHREAAALRPLAQELIDKLAPLANPTPAVSIPVRGAVA